MNRMKLAELSSGVGALVVGLGLGALLPDLVGKAAGLVILAGTCLHAFGMWDKHRMEATTQIANSVWVRALYWMCWLLLAAVVVLVVVWNG